VITHKTMTNKSRNLKANIALLRNFSSQNIVLMETKAPLLSQYTLTNS